MSLFEKSTNRFLIFLSLKWDELCEKSPTIFIVLGALTLYFAVVFFIEYGALSTIPWVVFCAVLTKWIVIAIIVLIVLGMLGALMLLFIKFVIDNWKKAEWIQKERIQRLQDQTETSVSKINYITKKGS